MRFTYFWPGWMVVLGIVIVIGVTVFFYFRVGRDVRPRERFLLIVLRGAAAAVLLGCLLGPVVMEQRDVTPPTHLSVLVDTSRSMGLMDGGDESRLDAVKELLSEGAFLAALRDRFAVHLYPFSRGLHESVLMDGVDSGVPELVAEGSLTDIGAAIRGAAGAWKGQQNAGVVLITDGAQNAGTLDVAAIAGLGVPVYAVGVGATEPPRDVRIQHVDYAPIAYTGHESVVRVSVVQTGYTGRTTQVSLRAVDGDALIGTARVTFDGDSTKQVVELRMLPESEGNFQYRVMLPRLEGELTDANNEQTFSVKVVKAKLKVFYLEGRPRWDYTFLKRALARDPDVEATCAVLSGRGAAPESVLAGLDGYYPQDVPASETPRFPRTLSELSAYDVLILGDLRAGDLTETQESAIVDFVERQGKPVIFLPSRQALGAAGLGATDVGVLLPIEVPARGCRVVDREFNIRLTQAGLFHPMLRMDGGESGAWERMPALARSFDGFSLRGGARVLMESGRGRPVLVLQRVGLGKSLVLAAEGFWQWGFGVHGFQEDRYRAVYGRFWAQVLRWMATDAGGQRVYVTTDASAYTVGERVRVKAYLYSETYQPQAGAAVEIEVVPPEGAPFQLRINAGDEDLGEAGVGNLYTAEFGLLARGTYRIRAKGRLGALELGEDSVEVYARPALAELESPELNADLLRRLSARTGGAYFDLTAAGSVAGQISDVHGSVFVDSERALWAHPLVLIVVVGLLGTEWFLRKRFGLV